MAKLTELKTHFAFGQNWESFEQIVNQDRVSASIKGMQRLFPNGELKGASLLDIDCGSGLSSLAAARLGVSESEAIDIDPNCVSATKRLLSQHLPGFRTVRACSVFDLPRSVTRQFDVVYSWGTLHHAGDTWRVIEPAASLVESRGYFAIGVYRKTPWCDFWTAEKRFYANAPKYIELLIRMLYKGIVFGRMLGGGGNPVKFVREKRKDRGMDFSRDVHDWLGGYPYESATADEVRNFIGGLGLSATREFGEPHVIKCLYLFTCCNEFIAVRKPT